MRVMQRPSARAPAARSGPRLSSHSRHGISIPGRWTEPDRRVRLGYKDAADEKRAKGPKTCFYFVAVNTLKATTERGTFRISACVGLPPGYSLRLVPGKGRSGRPIRMSWAFARLPDNSVLRHPASGRSQLLLST